MVSQSTAACVVEIKEVPIITVEEKIVIPYEGQGVVGIQTITGFQTWAMLAKQEGMVLEDVPCSMLIFDFGKTIHFWNFSGEVETV